MTVFLGNPTKEFEKTRHNAGFIVADTILPNLRWQVKFHSAYVKEGNMIYLKPMTYMNLSGTAVSEAASFFKIKSEEILIVHDDLELPLGQAKIQQGGGLQGHNGLRNIKERLGSDNFYRFRIGIGRPIHGDVRLYVTSNFTQNELVTLKCLIDKSKNTLLCNDISTTTINV